MSCAAKLFQPLAEVIGFAVVANRSQRVDLGRTQSVQVVDDRSSRSRAPPLVHHLVRGTPGFQARLRQSRIDFEVFVEEEVTKDGDATIRKSLQQFLEALRSHAGSRYW